MDACNSLLQEQLLQAFLFVVQKKKVSYKRYLPIELHGTVTAESAIHLFGECRFDQLDKAVNSSLLVNAVSDDADVGAADNTQRQYTQQRLGVYSPLFLLNPDRRLEFVCLLDKESSGTCVETNLIFDGNIFQIHTKLSHFKNCPAAKPAKPRNSPAFLPSGTERRPLPLEYVLPPGNVKP